VSGHQRRISCGRCGRVIKARAGSNAPVTHKCPHGKACVAAGFAHLAPLHCLDCESLRGLTAAARKGGAA
jgi:primosomal protein N'